MTTSTMWPRLRNQLSGVLLTLSTVAALLCALPAQTRAQDAGSGTLKTLNAGSLLIPMDNAYQPGSGTIFNLKAYGLANYLLQNNVPLFWIVRPGKAKDAADLTGVNARPYVPAIGSASIYNFAGGPLVVPSSYATKALPLINAFNAANAAGVKVYQITAAYANADVRYTLHFHPRIFINDVNATLASNVLDNASIPEYVISPQTSLLNNSCYTIVLEPHNTGTSGALAVRNFVEDGGNFYAQCSSVGTYENFIPTGYTTRYMTEGGTTGLAASNNSAPLTNVRPDEPYSQYIGDVAFNTGGSQDQEDWDLAPGASLRGSSHGILSHNFVNKITLAAFSTDLRTDELGGNVFYNGGHDYNGTAAGMVNLQRMMLNAVLTPATRPLICVDIPMLLPDLAVSKTHAPAQFTTGASASFTITVSNTGNGATVDTVTVVDQLPAGLSYISASGAGWTFSTSGQTLTARYGGIIAAGGSAAFTLNVLPANPGSLTNSAMVSGGGELDEFAGNNSASDNVTISPPPDLAITKSAPDSMVVGTNAVYTIVVTNTGASSTGGTVTVVDTLQPGLAYVSANSLSGSWNTTSGGAVTCAGGIGTCQVISATLMSPSSLATGQSASFGITVTPQYAATPYVVNRAIVSGGGNINLTNDTAAITTRVTTLVDLTISKTSPAQFTYSGNGTYTLTITNNGPNPSSGTVTVADTLPAGMRFVSGSGTGWTLSVDSSSLPPTPGVLGTGRQIVTATRNSAINAGALNATSITLNMWVGSRTASVTNQAWVSGGNDGYPANNYSSVATTLIAAADLTISKTSPASVTQGTNFSYTITVYNTGTAASSGNIDVRDTLPAGATYVSSAGVRGTWTFGTGGSTQIRTATSSAALAVGDSIKFTITATPTSAALPSLLNRAIVTNGSQIYVANDTAAVTTLVNGLTDLTIAKVATGNFQQGGSAGYTIAVTNVGTVASNGTITVTDVLPAGLTYVSGSGSGWIVSAAGQTVTATYANPLAASTGSASFDIVVSVAQNAGALSNIATVAGGNDADTTNNASQPVNITPMGRPHLTLLKFVTVPAGRTVNDVRPGDVLTYTIEFQNTGNADAVDAVVVEEVPAQLHFRLGSVTTNLPGGVSANVEYFNGAWGYTPTSGGCSSPAGTDGCVTKVRWTLLQHLAATAQGTVTIQAVVK